MDGKEAIAQYKDWYVEHYGFKPTEKLVETFCKMKGIDIEREEVAKVEEQVEYKVCSALEDVPTVASDGIDLIAHTANQYTEENYLALETNYNNLLGEFEEVSAIAREKGREIGTLAKHLTKATSDAKALLNMIKPYRDMLSAMDFKALQEIEKEVER